MYHYTMCGLPNVWLENGFQVHRSKAYGESVSIHDVKGLHRAIGLDIARVPRALHRDEIRFLRIELDMSQRALADVLGVKEITVRKLETTDAKISGPADRLLRILYLSAVDGDGAVKQLIDEFNAMDRREHEESIRRFRDEDGWRKKIA